jgi:DNA repair protein RadD
LLARNGPRPALQDAQDEPQGIEDHLARDTISPSHTPRSAKNQQPTAIELRPDQLEQKQEASALMRRGYKRVGISARTGTGKTVIASSMLKSAAERGFRSWFICHRRELLTGASRTFAEVGVDHGIIAAGFRANPTPLVQVASISSLLRCHERLDQPGFVIWDEAHHLSASSWNEIFSSLPDAFHIGLSATWTRLDGAPLDQFEVLVPQRRTFRWLVDRGILVPYAHLAPSEIDLRGIRVRMGDYVKAELVAAGERQHLNDKALRAYLKFTPGKRAIVFAVSIAESMKVAQLFRSNGVAAEHIDADTSMAARDAIIARFARGETLVLGNVDLFGEGFDLPAIEAVIQLRATQSLSLHLQQIGRGLRASPGKTSATVIDLVANWKRHGLASEDRQWTLEARSRPNGALRTDLWRCEACTAVNMPSPCCQVCGAPPRPAANRRGDVDIWLELIGNPDLLRQIRGMSHHQLLAWADDEPRARMAAIVRGWKPGWAYHHLRDRRAQAAGGAS